MQHLLVFMRQQVKQQSIEQTVANAMALPLPADQSKTVSHEHPNRRLIQFHSPSAHGLKSEILEANPKDFRHSPTRIALTGVAFIAEHIPERRGTKISRDITQRHQANRGIMCIGGEEPEEMHVSLRHDLESDEGQALETTAKIQPLVVFFLIQPFRSQFKYMNIKGLELHGAESPPAVDVGLSCHSGF
jgi:hypothetical protein